MANARHALLLMLILAPLCAGPVAASELEIAHFQRLSFDLRGHNLRPAEHAAVAEALASGAAESKYESHLDAWMTRDALKPRVGAFLGFITLSIVDPTGETFFHRLQRYDAEDHSLYYLPHTVEGNGPPCPPEESTLVNVWWQDEPISVCNDSYRPEVIFDEIGYCSGEAEPLMRQPPREGCGCGPMLMGCLPPTDEDPELDQLVETVASEEWFETAARIVDEDRPLDELITTSRTWQTGLAEFLYLRRDLLAELHDEPWSPEKQDDIEARITALDIREPGRWLERTGVYEGTGIWWTSLAPHALKIPVRPAAHHLLARFLGSDFHAVNVDASAVLSAVGRSSENLRTLSSITAAPMRFIKGCQGCHAPMDGVAGFLGEIQGPIYGSFPTGQRAEGEFFVTGAEDFRGKGDGIASLSSLVVQQPEFESVAVRRAFESVLLRPLGSQDQELFAQLVAEFRDNGHRWKPILRALYLSDLYKFPHAKTEIWEPAPADAPMAPVVEKVISDSCTRCHDMQHYLDLRQLPARDDVGSWKRIWARVNDYSMPPASFKGEVTDRFPIDPATRREFVGAVASMLGPELDQKHPPRRLDARGWVSLARDVASPELPDDRIAQLVSPLTERVVLRKQPPRGYNPAVQISIERISETLCEELAATGKRPTVEQLLERIHGREPTQQEIDEAQQLLERFRSVASNDAEAWTALCSTCLTSPDLLFELYVAGGAR